MFTILNNNNTLIEHTHNYTYKMDTATTAAITLTHHISSFGTASQLCSLLQSIDQLNHLEENFGECKRL